MLVSFQPFAALGEGSAHLTSPRHHHRRRLLGVLRGYQAGAERRLGPAAGQQVGGRLRWRGMLGPVVPRGKLRSPAYLLPPHRRPTSPRCPILSRYPAPIPAVLPQARRPASSLASWVIAGGLADLGVLPDCWTFAVRRRTGLYPASWLIAGVLADSSAFSVHRRSAMFWHSYFP